MIVRNDDNFSHVLGLSYSKRIPFMCGAGENVNFPEKFILDTLGSMACVIDMTDPKDQEKFNGYRKNLY